MNALLEAPNRITGKPHCEVLRSTRVMNVEIVCEKVWSEQTPYWTSSAHTSWIFPFRAFYMYFKTNIQTKEKLVSFLFHSMGERFGGVWCSELWSFLWWPFVVSIKRKFLSSLAVVGSKIHFSWTLWFQFPPLFCWLPLCNAVYFSLFPPLPASCNFPALFSRVPSLFVCSNLVGNFQSS